MCSRAYMRMFSKQGRLLQTSVCMHASHSHSTIVHVSHNCMCERANIYGTDLSITYRQRMQTARAWLGRRVLPEKNFVQNSPKGKYIRAPAIRLSSHHLRGCPEAAVGLGVARFCISFGHLHASTWHYFPTKGSREWSPLRSCHRQYPRRKHLQCRFLLGWGENRLITTILMDEVLWLLQGFCHDIDFIGSVCRCISQKLARRKGIKYSALSCTPRLHVEQVTFIQMMYSNKENGPGACTCLLSFVLCTLLLEWNQGIRWGAASWRLLL